MTDLTTEELIDLLRGYSLGLKWSGNIAGGQIVGIAADRLEEMLRGISDKEHRAEV